jgi:hypothetical protein
MGLGLSFHFESKPRGILRQRTRARALAVELADALARSAMRAFPELACFAERRDENGGVVFLSLHPAAEALRIEPDSTHGVHLTAKTNMPGPGWHVFLVEQLEQVTRSLDLVLRAGTEDDPLDETGYYASRDFGRLQDEMSEWLRSMGQLVKDHDPGTLVISMALGTPSLGANVAVAPMGAFTFEWLRALCELPREALHAACVEFFPWWDEGTTSRVRASLARALVFDLRWHPPLDERERAQLEVTRDLLRELDPAKHFGPDSTAALADELDALLASTPSELRPPRADGFGLRRSVLEHTFFGCVGVRVPAYAYFGYEDDGATAHCWWGDYSLHISANGIERGHFAATLARNDELAAENTQHARHTFEIEAEGGRGLGWVDGARSDEGVSTALAIVTVPGCWARATLAFGNAQDAEAEALLRTLRVHPDAD